MFTESPELRKTLAEHQLCWRLRTLPARHAKKDAVTGQLVTYPNPKPGGDPVVSIPPRVRVDVLYRPTMEVVHHHAEDGNKGEDGERLVTETVNRAAELVGKGAMKTPAQLAQENEQLRAQLKEAGLGEPEQGPGDRDPNGPEINAIEEQIRGTGLKIPPGKKNANWYRRCEARLEEAETTTPLEPPPPPDPPAQDEAPLLGNRIPPPVTVDSEPEPATIP